MGKVKLEEIGPAAHAREVMMAQRCHLRLMLHCKAAEGDGEELEGY